MKLQMKIIIIVYFFCCANNCLAQKLGKLTDTRDKKNYSTVLIGSNTWIAENLNADRFSNGDPIFEAKSVLEWHQAYQTGTPAWCYFNNDPKNGNKFGKLYNIHAVLDSRGIAPKGWHVATKDEWDSLALLPKIEGLKSSTGWGSWGCKTCKNRSNKLYCPFIKPNSINCTPCPNCYNRQGSSNPYSGNGTNAYFFNAKPAGSRRIAQSDLNPLTIFNDGFDNQEVLKLGGQIGFWWCPNKEFSDFSRPFYKSLKSYEYGVNQSQDALESGFSIRCVKNKIQDNYVLNETLGETQIGPLFWKTSNLNVSTFRNGDSILMVSNAEAWHLAELNKTPAWCYYEFNPKYNFYGKFYNAYAILDPRNISPHGWHIATKNEWQSLVHFLGNKDGLYGPSFEGIKLKYTSGWGGIGRKTNTTNFSALPFGGVTQFGVFLGINYSANWWVFDGSNSYSNEQKIWAVSLIDYDREFVAGIIRSKDELHFEKFQLGCGLGVRLVKDY